MAAATGADEAYDLLLRKEIETLFKEDKQFDRDIVRYADIALELGQPAFAAMVYWKARNSLKPETLKNRKPVEDFLYCLERLGVKDLKRNFAGDHAAEFKRIDARRAQQKSESPAFRAFAAPGGAQSKTKATAR
jgi:hypothetical protein